MATKVEFHHRSGRVQLIDERLAKALELLHKGTYINRAMQSAPTINSDRGISVSVSYATEPEPVPVVEEIHDEVEDVADEAVSDEKPRKRRRKKKSDPED
jgi:hypothetical protein